MEGAAVLVSMAQVDGGGRGSGGCRQKLKQKSVFLDLRRSCPEKTFSISVTQTSLLLEALIVHDGVYLQSN